MKPVARTALVITLVSAATVLGACQASAPGPATIVFEEMRFVPNRIDAVVGEPVRVTLTNKGLQRHDLNFAALHMPGLEGVEAILEPGETRTITLTFAEPGTHTFQCSLPGDAVAGMTGAVFVRP
jgi:uncharacterized cupredoxin-like copper-binding protein